MVAAILALVYWWRLRLVRSEESLVRLTAKMYGVEGIEVKFIFRFIKARKFGTQ